MARPSAGMLARMSMEPDDYPPPDARRREMRSRTSLIERKYDPHQLRDLGGEDGGRWVSNPATAAAGGVSDALKLAGKIDLAPDEKLISSGKVDAGAGGIRMALTERGGHRMLRFGAGGEGYGRRNRDTGTPTWAGNPTHDPLPAADRQRLDAEFDALGAEYESATPARREQIDARQADITDQLTTDDQGFNGTANLDEYAARRLADKIRPAMDEARDQNKIENAAWDEIEALEAKGNPDPARMAELRQVVDHGNGYLTFDEGIVPGSAWGDVHYSVELDEPTAGPYLRLGVAPKGAPDDWGQDLDWQGQFDDSEARKFLRLLDKMTAASPAT